MKIDLSLVTMSKTLIEESFDEHILPSMRDFLLTECVLDHKGVDRVIDQIKHIYTDSACGLSASFRDSDKDSYLNMRRGEKAEPDPQDQADLQSFADVVANDTATLINSAQTRVLFSLAKHLAKIDGVLCKRTIN